MDRHAAQTIIRDWEAVGRSSRAYARAKEIARTTAGDRIRKAMQVLGVVTGGLTPAIEPPGYTPGKSTVQYNADGQPVYEWRRMFPSADEVDEWIKGMAKNVPRLKAIKAPSKSGAGLLAEICLGDHHHGMRSWHKETGADWDVEISAKVLMGGIRLTLRQLPTVDKVVLVTMGDFFHADNRQAETEKSRHRLDVDGRYARTAASGAAALQAAIAEAATKAADVEVIILQGNHDAVSSTWLAMLMAARFENSPHVTVRTDPANRQYLRWGMNLLGYQHGDMVRPDALPALMAQESRAVWSDCKWGVWHLCHFHSRIRHSQRDLWEKPGVVVEYVPTLTAPDAYAADNGFISNRAISSYVYHETHGPKARLEISYDEIVEAIK